MTSTHMLRTRTPHCKKHFRVLTRNAIMHGNHAPHTSLPLLAAHKDAPLQEAHLRLDAQCHHTWQSCATHKLSSASCSKSRYTRLRDHVAPLPSTLGLITCKHHCPAQQHCAKFQSSCPPQTCNPKEGLRYDDHTHAAHKDAPLQEAIRVPTRNAVIHGHPAPRKSFVARGLHNCFLQYVIARGCGSCCSAVPRARSDSTRTWVDNLQAPSLRATAMRQVPEQLPAADRQRKRKDCAMTTTHMLRTKTPHGKKQVRVVTRSACFFLMIRARLCHNIRINISSKRKPNI